MSIADAALCGYRIQAPLAGPSTAAAAVFLLLDTEKGRRRFVYGAHGNNEMHRYTRSAGKEPGTVFHSGTLGEGMRAAIAEVERGYAR